jgi:DNA-nicking Smr family endonuclease
MQFNIGDKVRFLNDVGGGTIVKFIDNETVAVLNEDDFEIPVLIKELIPVTVGDYNAPKLTQDDLAYENSSKKQKNIEPENEPEEKEDDSISTFLAFVPQNQKKLTESDLELYFINDSNYYIYYNVMIKFGAFHVSHPGKLEPNSKIALKTFKKELFRDMDSLVVQSIFYKNKPHEVKPVISKEIKLNPTKFFKQSSFSENDFFYENAFIISIYDENKQEQPMPEISAEEIKRAMYEKKKSEKENKAKQYRSPKRKEVREIDLHIHELIDDTSGMSNKEMLDIQMEHFEREMQKAIHEKVQRIIFIHGKGNGTLKNELRNELKRKYKKYRFQDASFQEYGFGATLVYLH